MCYNEKATKATADLTHQDGAGMEGSISGVCQPRLGLQQRVNGFTGTCWPPDGLADGLKFVFLYLFMTGLSQSTDGSSRNGGALPAEKSVKAVLTDAARADTNTCTPTHSQNALLIFIHNVSSFPQPDCQSKTVKVIHLTPALLEYVIGVCRLLFCWYVRLTGRKKGHYLLEKSHWQTPVGGLSLCATMTECHRNLNQCGLVMNIPASYTSEQFLTDPLPLASLLPCAFFSNSPRWSLMGWMEGATVLLSE